MKWLICGGRDFSNYAYLAHKLDELVEQRGRPELVINGGARGADTMGGMWADFKGIDGVMYPADWRKHGKGAGPIRNQRMLDEGKPDLVVAFKGGNGTNHMMRIARNAGVEVVEL